MSVSPLQVMSSYRQLVAGHIVLKPFKHRNQPGLIYPPMHRVLLSDWPLQSQFRGEAGVICHSYLGSAPAEGLW